MAGKTKFQKHCRRCIHRIANIICNLSNGNTGGRKLEVLDIPEVEGVEMPKPHDFLSAEQRDGTGFLTTSGTITFTAKVTDSRGRVSDAKTVWLSLDYVQRV